jgi:hypothetical protein
MYIVYQIENHPDRLLINFTGPFTEHADASDYAALQEKCRSNYNGTHRLHDYIVVELTPP